MFSIGHWEYTEPFKADDYVGFIYLIKCKSTGQFYVGRKNFHSVVTKPPLKGFKRKRKIKSESNWKEYTSSSNEVNNLIEERGTTNFTFDILRLCKTKSEMSYYEVHYMIHLESMIDPRGLNGQSPKIPCRPKIH